MRALVLALTVAAAVTGFAGFEIDGRIPAGNIVVEAVEGDTVRLTRELRDTATDWFYWAFRVKGAKGRTLTFRFDENVCWGGPVGVRGPAVTTDGGRTWSYPCDGKSTKSSFAYTFGTDDEVRFYETWQYLPSDWEAFLAVHAADRGKKFETGALCRSRKGRDVPKARFGCLSGRPKYRIFMSSRHHCSEATATPVLEGVASAFLADDELGRWLCENVELMVVPFVDYDGVTDGDQGKYRAPHDHNRDYTEFVYPETRAIRDWILGQAGGRLDVFIDVHCPWIRNGKPNDTNEHLYTPWKDPEILPSAANEERFSELLEKLQCGSMRYKASDDLRHGQGWNTGGNYAQGWSAVIWACKTVKGLRIARSLEVPFANANGAVVTPETCRELGRDTAKVFRAVFTDVPARSPIILECEAFEDFGGWTNDSQFMDQMGSPYLLAHGLGHPVKDAKTTFRAHAGRYSVWVRTKDWTAPWARGGEGAGRFVLSVGGKTLPEPLGVQGAGEWLWTKAGEAELTDGKNEVALHDLTGFDGRCDAIAFTAADEACPDLDGLRQAGIADEETVGKDYDLVVVGGGIAGICAAVTASRLGLATALVHDRPVLGGNNSSEVRVHLGGYQNLPPYPRLGDVLAEFAPEQGGNARPAANYADGRKLAIVKAEPNLDLYLEERVNGVDAAAGTIAGVHATHVRTGARRRIRGRLFADCTGDGAVGILAGADCRQGREARNEYGESLAPERSDGMTMGASVQWYAVTNGTSSFPAEEWMLAFDERSAKPGLRGDWDWETGLGRDQVAEAERIRDYGLLVIYSNWSYLKNASSKRSEFAETELAWVASVAGKRESRRLLGDYILSQRDLDERRVQPDGTCMTTWTIDQHHPWPESHTGFRGEPFQAESRNRTIWPYPIPYRCLYSRNVGNLFMAGRDISVTHVALGTTRLMRTHGMMGEVVGMAAAVCRRRGCGPRQVYAKHFEDLRSLMTAGVGDGREHPRQDYNCQASLDPEIGKKYLAGRLAGAVAVRSETAIDFTATDGRVKPVNGVGQPPMLGLPVEAKMFHYLKEAGIPYSRLHDVGGWQGQHRYVDIPNVFPDFDADENDPKNYMFDYTDILIKNLVKNGVEPFYRLGVSIENPWEWGMKIGTNERIVPPKDFAKWARICEHVIRHYTEGWANGFRYKMTYWEIWNEPDNREDPSISPLWQAPFSEYIRFYGVVAPYLKAKFPHLKIGGFGCCGFYDAVGASAVGAAHSSPRTMHFVQCAKDFLAAARENGWPLDFFSYHSYSDAPDALKQVVYADRLLNEHGFTSDRTARIYNEWLPVVAHENLGTAKQAAQIAAELIGLQNGPCDVACIYDGRCGIGNYSPLFNPMTYKPHKAYYVFLAFNELRKLGTAVRAPATPEGVSAAAATDGKGRAAVLVANISGQDWTPDFDFGAWRVTNVRTVDAATDWGAAEMSRPMANESVRLYELKRNPRGHTLPSACK